MSFQDIEAGRPFASRRSLINGKQDPTQAVASGIFQINTAVSTFQRLVNTLGTPKDTPELREKLHKTRLHIGQLVKDTSAKLKEASEIDHHSNVNANKKIADAKLAKDFQAVLKEFQKAQRLSAERETAYTPFVPQSTLSSSEVDVTSDKPPEQRALLMESKRQEVLFLDNEIAFNEAIIDEREQGIQEIQQQIGEVNEIFKDLAVLVHEQGTMIGMLAFGDIWDCAFNRHHCACCLVKDSQFRCGSNTLYTWATDRMPLADDFTGFNTCCGIHTSLL
ncbi:PREDICTED: syntaxin-23-like isoform X1 [Lupinus angustifolius]|uniref:syntaxin-23-like isoform X1 n=1 Tax=Lupinus angustifolius TaxID=3871 RepID=UPI00092F4EB7|nr:PREDICTED: syntaxin-23-like isoform X1 [Lupinus angustifolius]